MLSSRHTFKKQERICSKKAIEHLFSGKANSFTVFPFRVVYEEVEKEDDFPLAILISVSKRRFKHAVKRNRIKRQIREGYRKNKHELSTLLAQENKKLHVAFIYIDKSIRSTEKIEKGVCRTLDKLKENYSTEK